MITLKDKKDTLNRLIGSNIVNDQDKEVLELIRDEDLASIIGDDEEPKANAKKVNPYDPENYLISVEEANERKEELFTMWFDFDNQEPKEPDCCNECGEKVNKYV